MVKATPVPEVAVLLPSPLGSLGLKARGKVIVELTIVPTRSQRRRYETFHDAKRSDFLDETLGRLSEYFAGARRNLDLAFDLEPARLDPFTRTVLEAVTEIPYGETRTYQKLAASIGAIDRYRLVRAALMNNPLPILVPCHRVVPRRSGPGSYIAGTRKKKWLLEMEAARQREG